MVKITNTKNTPIADDPQFKDLLILRGQNLRTLRKHCGMTQDDVAFALGYESGSSMISQIERGKTDMGPQKLRKAAELFGVEPWVIDNKFTEKQIMIIRSVFKNLLIKPKEFPHYETVVHLLGVDPDK